MFKYFTDKLPAIAVVLPMLLISTEALAMRCGNYIITKGDPQAKVLKYCGDPVQTQKSLGLRTGVYVGSSSRVETNSSNSQLNSRGQFLPYGRREVLVELWVYNFGPNKFMREVAFEAGIVTEVRKLDYGYHE